MTLKLEFRLFRSQLSFGTLYDSDLNEAIDETSMILSQKCSIVVLKFLNTFKTRQSFSS